MPPGREGSPAILPREDALPAGVITMTDPGDHLDLVLRPCLRDILLDLRDITHYKLYKKYKLYTHVRHAQASGRSQAGDGGGDVRK